MYIEQSNFMCNVEVTGYECYVCFQELNINKPTIKSQSTDSAMGSSISVIFWGLLFIIPFIKLLHITIVLVIVFRAFHCFWKKENWLQNLEDME